MTKERKDAALRTLEMIQQDMVDDVQRFDGSPRLIGTMCGNLAAAISTLAGVLHMLIMLDNDDD